MMAAGVDVAPGTVVLPWGSGRTACQGPRERPDGLLFSDAPSPLVGSLPSVRALTFSGPAASPPWPTSGTAAAADHPHSTVAAAASDRTATR